MYFGQYRIKLYNTCIWRLVKEAESQQMAASIFHLAAPMKGPLACQGFHTVNCKQLL